MDTEEHSQHSAYFEFSQGVKDELNRSPNLMCKIREHLLGKHHLEEIRRGDKHAVYRVGKLNSGLWVALRENYLIKDDFEGLDIGAGFLTNIYEDYCITAEQIAAAGNQISPSFCVGGFLGSEPFLLTEDLSEGGKHPTFSEYVGSIVEDFRKKDCIEQQVRFDFGLQGLLMMDPEIKEKIELGTFDINTLKYFNPRAVLNL